MRMWMIDPNFMCLQHRLGEHGEIHKFLPSFRKAHKVHGRFYPVVQIQFKGFKERHDLLASTLKNHNSPLVDLPDFESIYPEYYGLKVNLDISISDLCSRCPDCRKLLVRTELY